MTLKAHFALLVFGVRTSYTSHCTKNETADLVTFTEEFLNGKLHFLCSVTGHFSKTCAHFSNIAVNADFSEVSLQLLKINTSLISISAHFSLINEYF